MLFVGLVVAVDLNRAANNGRRFRICGPRKLYSRIAQRIHIQRRTCARGNRKSIRIRSTIRRTLRACANVHRSRQYICACTDRDKRCRIVVHTAHSTNTGKTTATANCCRREEIRVHFSGNIHANPFQLGCAGNIHVRIAILTQTRLR